MALFPPEMTPDKLYHTKELRFHSKVFREVVESLSSRGPELVDVCKGPLWLLSREWRGWGEVEVGRP